MAQLSSRNPQGILRDGPHDACGRRASVILWQLSDRGNGPDMRKAGSSERLKQGAVLLLLLAIGVFAVAGPTGLLAWSGNAAALEARKAEIAQLTEQRDALRNRVKLLDPEAADPDLASELVREQLGVIHEDEVVITLEDE